MVNDIARKQMDGSGGTISIESLVCYHPKMTYTAFSPKERKLKGIKDSLVRLSVDIEDKEDLLSDLKQALGK